MEGKHADVPEQERDDDFTQQKQEQQSEPHATTPQALSLKWAFGFNRNATGAVFSLSDDSHNAIFYTAAHSGIIYDYVHRTQTLLQGHCNPITACAVSSDKRWIVTADQGKDSMIVMWDAVTGAPIRTIFEPHANGVTALSLSPDAMFLVTLSSSHKGLQEVSVWEWTQNHDNALYSCVCPTVRVDPGEGSADSNFENEREEPADRIIRPSQNHVLFNEQDVTQFVTTGEHYVTFWSWKSKKLEHQTPPQLRKADFGSKVGEFTCTVFLGAGAQRAVSGTNEGNLVMWDISSDDNGTSLKGGALAEGASFSESKTQTATTLPRRSAIKMVKLNRHGSIPYLTTHNDLLVVCGEDESVRLYDMEFRIVAWYEDLDAGPVTSVSFNSTSSNYYVDTPIHGSAADDDNSAGAAENNVAPEKYVLNDFVVSTSRALIIGVDATIFDDANSENRHGTLLLQGFDGRIAALLAHPAEPVLVTISETGIVQAWDYVERRLTMVRMLGAEEKPRCAAFSPNGSFIAIGFNNGMLRILRWAESRDMGEVACFYVRPGREYSIATFSPDSRFLGLADSECCVALFRFVPEEAEGGNVDLLKVNQGKRHSEPGPGLDPCDSSESRNGWTYIGRHGSHTERVTSLNFGRRADGMQILVSVGADGALVEYDLMQSSVVDGVTICGRKKVEHGDCMPTCCLIEPAINGTQEDFVVVANSEFKIKTFNVNNKTCRKTTLGPTYGGHLTQVAVINKMSNADSMQYLAYATAEKVIGLVKMPLDGNPFNSMGLIAHPGEISGFAVSHDSTFLLSAGGDDMTVNLWAVNTSVLDAAGIVAAEQSVPGVAKGLVPFLPLLEGGHKGVLYEGLVDFFYYAQLRCQGEDTTSPRRAEGLVPLAEVPNLMRALGFYPTEAQIKDMCSEVRYSSEFSATAKRMDTVNVEQFIKLFINHRPVLGITKDRMQQSFETIKAALNTREELDWKSIKCMLEQNAEAMPTKELESCLTMLMGRKALVALRPSTLITPAKFTHEILGFQLEQKEQTPRLTSRHK